MPWPHRVRRQRSTPPLATPLSELDPDGPEVIEVETAGRLEGLAPRKDDHSLREVPYAPGARDAGSLAGIWEALGRS
ncbi:MAG: hypothetical protein LC744_04090 [Chloroflexi bacterium]|nr:hypothetical protein [Chloroflexota bacterium]